jgi:hypothetical protein
VEVVVSNVPGSIDHVPEHLVLESLDNYCVARFGASPELDTICPNGQGLRSDTKRSFACFRHVCEKLLLACRVCPSVRATASNNSALSRRIFMRFHI